MAARSARFALALMILALAAWPGGRATAEESLSGHLLVATPELVDSNFARTIVFLVHHDPGGAFGLVVNEPMGDVPIEHLLARLAPGQAAPETGEQAVTVHYGGPVEPGMASFLHSSGESAASSVEIDEGIAFSRDPALLDKLARGEGPRQMIFTLGYSGWAPGQLEAELERGDWFVLRWQESLVFGPDDALKWDRAVALGAPEL